MRLAASQLSIDPRTLGLTRILIALLLLFDLGKRAVDLATWYSNSGLLPDHTLVPEWGPAWQMSPLWLCSDWREAAVAFALIALVYVALLLGYRTRLAHALALMGLISLHARVDSLCNAGDFAFCALLWWTLFLPMGARFSIDAVRRSLQEPETSPAAIRSFVARPRPAGPVWSLAVLAVTTQLAVIYFFNAVQKDGETWREGSAIHYLLQQEGLLTPLGFWARDHLPFSLSRALSHATLAIQGVVPFLILSPFGRPWTRRVAILLILDLHIGIALFVNLGVSSPVMCVFATLLITTADWDALETWASPRRRRRVYYDDACGVCFQLARIAARLDLFSQLDLRAISEARSEDLPRDFDPRSFEQTLLVIDPGSGRFFVRAAAWSEMLMSLPLGTLPGLLLKAPGVRAAANLFYDAFSRNRTRISSYLGYAACGIAPGPAALASHAAPSMPSNDTARWRTRIRVGLREASVVFLIVAATGALLQQNRRIPDGLRVLHPPTWLQATVSYTRLQQSWSLFAPNVPVTERTLAVVAETLDGRRVDPVRAAASNSDVAYVELGTVARGYDVFWVSYMQRIEGRASHHRALRDWIMAHHERTGNQMDRVVHFDAVTIELTSPLPGELEPGKIETRKFLQGP